MEEIGEDIRSAAGEKGTSLGTGGMITKIEAARMATQEGIHVVIANGSRHNVLYDLLDGKAIGTLFVGRTKGNA